MVHKIDIFRTGEAAKVLRVSTRTLRRWEDKKKLVPNRKENGRRYYTRDQLEEFIRNHQRFQREDGAFEYR